MFSFHYHACAGLLLFLPLFAFSQQDITTSLLPNVVSIRATFAEGEVDYGFGFITAERLSKMYIATAAHVVFKEAKPLTIEIEFYQHHQTYSYPGTSIIQLNTDSEIDVALIEVDKPTGWQWQWRSDCLAAFPGQGQAVWFIGRNQEWYVPPVNVRGALYRTTPTRLYADIVSIQAGTSGAPMLGEEGMVGLITHDQGNQAEATAIEIVKQVVTDNGKYPYLFSLTPAGFKTGPAPPDPNQDEGYKDLQAWRSAKSQHTKTAYENYLKQFSKGYFRKEALDSLRQIEQAELDRQEDFAWELAKEKNTTQSYDDYLGKYKNGRFAAEARQKIGELERETKADPNMVLLKGGTFTMGCTPEQTSCGEDEKPAHQVTVSDFYLSKYEVTVKDFQAFIDATRYQTDADKAGNSFIWTGSTWDPKKGVNWKYDARGNLRPTSEYNHPVIHVSWNDAVAYCEWRSKQTGRNYRLPTEAEWEYAARGGNQSKRYQYAGSNNLEEVAWYTKTTGDSGTKAVGTKKANELGLYDMSGNVWEWCADWYGAAYYAESPATDPKGPDTGTGRVLRGGSWDSNDYDCRVSNRSRSIPVNRYIRSGFRLAQDFL